MRSFHSSDHRVTPHPWVVLVSALILGALIALSLATAARGGQDLPREAVAWLTGTKPKSVSSLYDGLIWAGVFLAFSVAVTLMAFVGPRRPGRR